MVLARDIASTAFLKSFSMDATDFKNLQSISESYTALGNTDKALEYSIMYLDKNPDAKPSEFSKLASIYIDKVKNGEDKDANWLKAMGVYDNLAAKYPHTANFVKFQKGHQAYVCEKDDEAIGYLTGLINDLKAKGDLDEDEKGYLLNACSEVGYIYWASKNDLDTAKPFYETVIQLDRNNSIAKKALGLDAPAEEATE